MTDLILRDDSQLQVIASAEAYRLRDDALGTASLVVKVANDAQEQLAVLAISELDALIKSIESARVTIKAPVLDYCRNIDGKAKEFSSDLHAEKMRIGRIIGDYRTLLEARRKAEEAVRQEELDEIERSRMEQRAKAQSHAELDAIDERANQETASVQVVANKKPAGLTVKDDWEITVINVWALASAYQSCVNIEVKIGEVKALLNAGLTPPGIIAKRINRVEVRTAKPKALTV